MVYGVMERGGGGGGVGLSSAVAIFYSISRGEEHCLEEGHQCVPPPILHQLS